MHNAWPRLPLSKAIGPKGRIIGGPFGSDLTQSDYVDSGVPVIRVSNQVGVSVSGEFVFVSKEKAQKLKANIARPGDIIVVQRGSTYGKVSRIPYDTPFESFVVCQSQMAITVDEMVASPEFLFQYLRSSSFTRYVQSEVVQTGQPHINLGILKRAKILVPPLPEQLKIAEVLRTWDEAIKKLEALRVGNLRRRVWMRSHLFSGRTRLPSYSGIWSEVTLREVLTEHGLRGTGAEEVFSVSVHKGLINQIEHLGRSFAAVSTGHYNRVLPGDMVYTKSPTGDFPLGIIKQSKISKEVIVSPLYGVFTPATPALGVILDALFESPDAVRNYLSPLVQKGAKNTIAITNRRFLEGKVRLPMDPKEQAAIADVIETSQAELAAIDTEVKLVTQQKRGLMQKLLTGEWRVKSGGGND